MTTRQIYLYGSLAEKYGKDAKLVDGATTTQVVQNLIGLLGKGFKQMLKEGHFNVLRGKRLKKNNMAAEEVGFNLGKTKELHIYPSVAGRGKWGQAIIGIILIVVGIVMNIYAAGSGNAVIIAGVGMLAGGIMAAMAAKPMTDKAVEQAGLNPSFIFNGTVNVTEQGGPVPVILGRAPRASSVVLSAGLSNKSIN